MIIIMFKKNPEKLFQKAVKHWTSAKHEIYDWGGINWVNHGYQNALDECDKILDILYEKGDESKPEYYQSTKRGESHVKYHFDNLTQKTHWFKGFLLAYPLLIYLDHESFKSAMLEFDKTIQINLGVRCGYLRSCAHAETHTHCSKTDIMLTKQI